ncbi:hypothetical protein [Rhizobium sp. RAF56]|uniref:hypothetical protein n=1 Tax=Rhizobium sp. RAF56 TaxID=3233062 RepID=UPI003F971525
MYGRDGLKQKGVMMAEEIVSPSGVENPSADTAATPVVKKQRKPRSPKPATVQGSAESVTSNVKSGRGRKKTVEVGEKTASSAKKRPGRPGKNTALTDKAPRKPSASQGGETQEVAPVATDGIAELLELEAENQRLRAALSAKLRAENADLRRRLGLD